LVKALVVLTLIQLEAIALRDSVVWIGTDTTYCMALASGHWVFQISSSIIKTLGISKLTRTSSHKVGVGRIRSTPLDECILVNLLISRFGCTLIIILVALTTNTAHTDATHA
jgi:hypothetical protein